jgi:hypothetical protein
LFFSSHTDPYYSTTKTLLIRFIVMCILSSLMLAVIHFTCSIFYYALLLFNRTLIFQKISKLEISSAIYLVACRIPTFSVCELTTYFACMSLMDWQKNEWFAPPKLSTTLSFCTLYFIKFVVSAFKTSNEFESSVIIVHEHWGKRK